MKYLVLECHFSYAVVLDEDGRFLTVANLHYQPGQTVTDVVAMQTAERSISPAIQTPRRGWVRGLAAIAACLVLAAASMLYFARTPYASVYMTINPEVRVDINRRDVVVGIDGLNEDGIQLLDGYSYQKKPLDLVMDDLVDRAIDMGYLSAGGQITLTLDARDDEWVVSTGDALNLSLSEQLSDRLSVTVSVETPEPNSCVVTIPANPDGYRDSDYGSLESASSTPVFPDTNYGPDSDGATGYDDTADDGMTDYGDAGYDDTDYGPGNDGITDYNEPDGSGDSGYSDVTDDGSADAPSDGDSDSGYGGSDDDD